MALGTDLVASGTDLVASGTDLVLIELYVLVLIFMGAFPRGFGGGPKA